MIKSKLQYIIQNTMRTMLGISGKTYEHNDLKLYLPGNIILPGVTIY